MLRFLVAALLTLGDEQAAALRNQKPNGDEMKLVDDARRIFARSLSFWMQIAGLAWLILPEAWYRWTGQDYDPYFAWWIAFGLLFAGTAGRLIRQDLPAWREWLRIIGFMLIVIALAFLLSGRAHASPASEADTLKIAVPFIIREEGMVLEAYLDVVNVPTICAGLTEGVHLGMKMTREQCEAKTRIEIAKYRARLHRYFTEPTIDNRLPATRDAAYTSTAYNCGVPAIGRSTATKRLNAGNVAGGCDALTWWNKAGRRVIRGLVERRKREKALCMIGVAR